MTKRKELVAKKEGLFLARADRTMARTVEKINGTGRAGSATVSAQAALFALAGQKFAQMADRALRGDRPSLYAERVIEEYEDQLIWLLEEYNERLLAELDRLEV